MDMDHYDVVPQQLSEKILATAKRPAGDEDE
jgi:elongation factor G